MTTFPKSTNKTSESQIVQLQHNELAYANRNLSVGGVYTILGALDAEKFAGQFASVMVVNSDAVVHYVAVGVTGMPAPSGITNGIMIPAGQTIYIGTGVNTTLRSDSNKVGGYLLTDHVVPNSDDWKNA